MEDGLIEAEGSKATNNVESERVVVEDFVFIVVVLIVEGLRVLGLGLGVYAGIRSFGRRRSLGSPAHRHREQTTRSDHPTCRPLYSRPRGGLSAALQLKKPCDCV